MDKVEDMICPHTKIRAPILYPHTVHSKSSCPKKRPYPSLKDMAGDMELLSLRKAYCVNIDI